MKERALFMYFKLTDYGLKAPPSTESKRKKIIKIYTLP